MRMPEPERGGGERVVVQRRPDRVGLHLGAGHELGRHRRGVAVLQAGRGGADDHDLPAHVRGVEPALLHVDERQGREGLRDALVVDPGLAVVEALGDLAGRRPDGLDREAGDGADPLVVLADHPAGVGRQVRHPDERLGGVGVLLAAEDLRVALRVDLGRGEDRARHARDGVEQGEVLLVLRRLGELHVVDDGLRARAAQPVDDLRVAAALERPDLVVGRVERLGVDRHDRDLALRPVGLQARAGVERLILERVPDARQQHDEADRHPEDRGERERAKARPAPHGPSACSGPGSCGPCGP